MRKQIALFENKIIEDPIIYKCYICKGLFKRNEGSTLRTDYNTFFRCSKCNIKSVFNATFDKSYDEMNIIRDTQNNKCACCGIELKNIKGKNGGDPDSGHRHHKGKNKKGKKIFVCWLCYDCNKSEPIKAFKHKAMIQFDYETGKIIN